MADTSLFSLAHMLVEQDMIHAQLESLKAKVKVLADKDQALDRLIAAAREYEATFEGAPSQSTKEATIEATGVSNSSVPPPPTLVEAANGVMKVRRGPRLRLGPRTPRPAPLMQATREAVERLLDLMGPLTIAEILDLLESREALNLPNDDTASNVLSARMSNSGAFKGRRGQGWWFKDRPWPGEEDNAVEGVKESGPQGGSDPASGPDNGGLQPDRSVETL